ncbi:hypothetical protein D0817_20925 [Flavobacterium cupreum]|uniref:Uncharacterized protein n=1 Tax=Flavobacterium cupreum TaxID=2133766 RepID=A0A434A206_9FLAO|nr:hypothetical protein D0817_20925 [Flavobacterium cupreum]
MSGLNGFGWFYRKDAKFFSLLVCFAKNARLDFTAVFDFAQRRKGVKFPFLDGFSGETVSS